MKLFEEFDKEFDSTDLQMLEYNSENVKKLTEYQKENGGVLRIPKIATSEFEKFGYEIKYLTWEDYNKLSFDKKFMDDVLNYNKVNYVICVDEISYEKQPNDIKNFDEFDEIEH